MKREEINIRDPFVLPWRGTYYMYGSRGETTFAKKAYGIDVYKSSDLEDWTGPIEVFHKPDNFWADSRFWAPEVHVVKDRFYMFATFGVGKRQGTSILVADSPEGPFVPNGPEETITPPDWSALDGTFYCSRDGAYYMVFCHEWKQVHDGEICAVKLSEDLTHAIGQPFVLLRASQAKPLVKSLLFRNFVTDGPYLIRTEDGRLHMLWSSFGKSGYNQLIAHSDNDDVDGTWTVALNALFDRDGGHGMIFQTFDGQYMLALHRPNTPHKEHPVLLPLIYKNGDFQVMS